ncbi:hypothetical protein TSUD_77950 [Trifolium subterraneum]|uniref:Uncharacterized protein n=1 Tax=Trifolium subterraneum TaxID=3900 RepID=A0A2Z6NDJ5_TRISU|nr:hypothetical protein TSUD_77950 [Trifolium subterraneum]
MKFNRPILDGNFITVQLHGNLARAVWIEANIPAVVEESLIECLKSNVDLVACSPEKMPDIDPSVACHRLNVNPDIKYEALR